MNPFANGPLMQIKLKSAASCNHPVDETWRGLSQA